MGDNEKTEILLSLRTTAQESLREMRARVSNLVSTAIALFTVFLGWIIQRQSKPSLPETLLFICVILVTWLGNLLILWDIRRGFITTMNISVRIEKCLRLYEPNVFSDDGEPLFPQSYLKPMKATHFKRFEFVLSLAAIVSVLILIMKYLLP